MVYYLLFVVCLGHNCVITHDPNAYEFPSQMACAYMGELVAQRWLADHPNWELGRIICSTAQPA